MELLVWTAVIFIARVLDVSLGTIRVQLIVRRKKFLAALTGFVEVLIVSRVIQDIQHWPYVLSYAAGFATGTLLGMYMTEKLERRVVQATFICQGSQDEIEVLVRESGFALTRYDAIGRDGHVEVMDVICTSSQLARLVKLVTQIDPKAFLYTHDLASLKGGYVYGLKSKI
jgi:uncharacterized protein YebE (UPF0316 family)